MRNQTQKLISKKKKEKPVEIMGMGNSINQIINSVERITNRRAQGE
jgi:hypothetical protein